ncbi:hypothetical protein V5O48_017696 [Marasmius crinis-equi]|uniref:No apical meristem-associated C-terminal domain-containing protein n=1 Tax=Marasmius crinis-equi TaxID=585013 RepID=A0ABR3ENB0_9AGAR
MAKNAASTGSSTKAKSTSRASSASAKTKAAAGGKKKASKHTGDAEDDIETFDGEGPKEGKEGKLSRINWGEVAQSVVSTILEESSIKQKLYPSPGPNPSTTEGGGAKKSEAHWEICQAIFTEHDIYKDDFRAALEAKTAKDIKRDRDPWIRAMKSQLRRMELKTAEIRNAMGQTGMGLKSADQINMDADSNITNAWKKYGEKFPWFFQFRDIIAERPNVVLTGVGNSTTDIDIEQDILGQDDDDGDLSSIIATSDMNDVGEPGDDGEDDEDDVDEAALGTGAGSLGTKRRSDDISGGPGEEIAKDCEEEREANAKLTKTASKKTGPRKSTSKPAEPPTKRAKKSKVDEFAEIAKAEEGTRQREIDLDLARSHENVEKIRLQETAMKLRHEQQMERMRMKKELKEKELEYKKMKLGANTGMMRGAGGGYMTAMGNALMSGAAQRPGIMENSMTAGLESPMMDSMMATEPSTSQLLLPEWNPNVEG